MPSNVDTALPFIRVERAKGIEQRQLQEVIDRNQAAREAAARTFERGLFDDRQAFEREQFGFNQEIQRGQLGLDRDRFGFDQRQFDTQQQNRQQILQAFGLAPAAPQGGGLSGQGFADGGLSGQGFADDGSSGGLSPGGGEIQQTNFNNNSLFGQLLGGGAGTSDQSFGSFLNDLNAQRESLLGQAQDFGQGQRAALQQQFADQAGSLQSAFEGRGLGASNLVAAAQSGLAREQALGSAQLEDQLLGRRLDLEQGLNAGINDARSREFDRANQRALQGISTIGAIGTALI